MDGWKRFHETLPVKEEVSKNLTMEIIINVDYKHAKSVWEDFG